MKKKKSLKGIIFLILAMVILIGGVGGGAYYWKTHHAGAVEVQSVAALNSADWILFDDDEGASGTVLSDVSQNVRVPEDKVIDKIYVEEGQKVKIGDKLLEYDKTLLELDQELQELVGMELELEIRGAEADLKKLKATTPIVRKDTGDDDDISSDATYSSDDDDDDDELAQMMSADRMMLAASEEEIVETGASLADSSAQSESGEENADDKEVVISDAAQTDESEEAEMTEEEVIDSNDQQKLSADDLKQMLSDDKDSERDIADILAELDMKNAAGEKNLGVKDLYTNLRIKAIDANKEETLLVDTKQKSGDEIQQADVREAAAVKLVPHFKEPAEKHFAKENTYLFYIAGLKVPENMTGKIYGTAVIDGNDYPEIGGFTLAQEKKAGVDVAKLIMAFHNGLDEQHERRGELDDMYVELPLDIKALSGDVIAVYDGESEKAVDVVELLKPEEPETEDEAEAEDKEEPEEELLVVETAEMELDPEEAALVGEPGIDPQDDPNNPNGDNDDSESEEFHVIISWDSNGHQNAVPDNVLLKFNSTDTDAKELSLILPTSDNTDGAGEDTAAEGIVLPVIAKNEGTENSWDYTVEWNKSYGSRESYEVQLIVSEFKSRNVSWDEQTGDLKVDLVYRPYAPEEFKLVIEWDDKGYKNVDPNSVILYFYLNKEDISDPEKTSELLLTVPPTKNKDIAVEDPDSEEIVLTVSSLKRISDNKWEYLIKWDSRYGSPEEYIVVPVVSEYRSSEVKWDDLTGELIVKLTYQPNDVISRTDPLDTLTWETGDNGLWYKGSGTESDPYVFFCTEGAVIRSSFMNWVYGYDAAAENKISDGYHVRLEIRGGDDMTQAFIKELKFDGTQPLEEPFPLDVYWVFSSENGMTKYQDVAEEQGDNLAGLGGGGGGFDSQDGYTAEELAQAIADKEHEIRKLNNDKKEADLKLKKYNKEIEACTVRSAVDGYVKSLGGNSENDAFMVVSSEGGLYIKTTVSEMDLDQVDVGQQVSYTSWESGMNQIGTITSIDTFPSTSSNDEYFSGNVNSSHYPVIVALAEDAVASEYESVQVKFMNAGEVGGSSGIYLERAYIRSENGRSYVYAVDADGLLEKRYVRTGGNSYGYIEIRSGLGLGDRIAFPYAKNAKEGAKTAENDDY